MIEIKLKNPQAALLCSGVVDICDIGVELGKLPCLVLVNAVKGWPLTLTRFETIECRHAAEMAVSLGLVTEEQMNLSGKIIGSFFADRIPEDYCSPWLFGCNRATSYWVSSPMFLDTPQDASKKLTFSEAREGFAVMKPAVTASGEELVLPVSKQTFAKANVGQSFTIPMTEKFAVLLFSNDRLTQYTTLTLLCEGYNKSFKFDRENGIVFPTDKNMCQKFVFSAMRGENIVLPYFKFVLKERLL